MMTGLASVREARSIRQGATTARSFEDEWRYGEPSLERFWEDARASGSATISVLVELVKVDLSCRYARGQKPQVADYLRRFPELEAQDDRVLSLIYEEFCLREESGDTPDADQFCDQYEPWRESLVSQLRYHRLLSQVVSPQKPAPRFPEPGEDFEEFHLESLLGQGGAGRVYLARDNSLAGRRVALKVSLDTGHEPSILARLEHDHIVPVHSVVFQSETSLRGLCMPYRPGLPLDQVIRKLSLKGFPNQATALLEVVSETEASKGNSVANRPGWQGFPIQGTYVDGVAWLVGTLARALSYAHDQGVLHRDVKPANVLLTLREGPQVLDFNLAHDPNAPDQAESALRGGTLPYMAPEQLEAFLDPEAWGKVGASADLYSLGLVMHELLTGEAPQIADQTLPLPRTIRALLDQRMMDPVSLSRALNPNVPHALEAITARCLAALPQNRYASALELAEDLECFLKRQPLRHAKNPSARERVTNWSRRNRTRVIGFAAILLVSSVVLARPIASTLVPVERREAFLTAVKDVDSDRSREAIPQLESSVKDSPTSPLPHFYLAVALRSRGDDDGASQEFAQVFLNAGEPKLLEWGRKNQHVAEHLEALGLAFLEKNQFPIAEKAFSVALKLSPDSTAARGGMVKVHVFKREYEPAYEILAGLVKEAEARDSKQDRNVIVDWYTERAQVAVLWMSELLQRDPKNGAATARVRYAEALADLDRVDARLNPLDLERIFLAKATRGETLIALGNLDMAAKRTKDSSDHLIAARTLIEEGLEPQSVKERQDRLRLRQRLEDAIGRLKGLAVRDTLQDKNLAPSAN